MADTTQTLAGSLNVAAAAIPLTITLDETQLAAVIKAALGSAPAAGGGISDAAGNVWGVVAGQVTLNGVVDTTTANVQRLILIGTTIYQVNAAGLCWEKTSPTAAWVQVPIPPNT